MIPIIKVTFFVLILTFISGCGSGKSGQNSKVETCVSKGVAYFKSIDSYPRLHSAPNKGRRAEDVARERCNRTTNAFSF